MNGNCLDIGTIQAFLDGETRPEEAVRISDHVTDCDACTMMLAQAEEENSMVFSVLDREMNTLVPTQRLWNRINESIAEEKSRTPIWQRLAAFVSASLLNPSFAAAAGILLVIGIAGVVFLNRSGSTVTSDNGHIASAGQPSPTSNDDGTVNNATTDSGPSIPGPVNVSTNVNSNSPKVTVTKFSDEELNRRFANASFKQNGPKEVRPVPASSQFIPGEESYIKTINDLQQGVTAQTASMNASSQVAYARDMAVVDDSINKMRDVVRKNPRNRGAKQVLYSAYQDKIDLLKSSAQRDELMASLQ